MTGWTFISYSRKQLYFAEALTLHLQKKGIETWFDLQQLEAGTDWAKALEHGYSECGRLILVASQASLSSPYVAVEWQTALKNDREVILAVYEDVDLPDKLRGLPTFDFRGNFDRKLAQLANYLRGEKPRHDRIPAPGKFPYPLRMPASIWIVLVSPMLPFFWGLLIPLLSLKNLKPTSSALSLYLVFLLVSIVFFLLVVQRFWLHRLAYQNLRYGLLLALFVQVPLLILSLALLEGQDLGTATLLLNLATLLLNLFVYFILIHFSGALLRWFQAGQVSQGLRRRIHKRLLMRTISESSLRDQTVTEAKPVLFCLHSDPADKPIATRVERILAKFGHRRTDHNEAEKHIVVITNRTPRKLVAQVSETYGGNAIFILGSTIDFSESMTLAGQYQWLDFRESDQNDIKLLGQSLHDFRAWQREYALEVTPTEFKAFDAPTGVYIYRYYGLQGAGALIGGGAALLLGGRSFLEGLASLILGGILFWIVQRALFRRVTLIPAYAAVVGIPLAPSIFQSLTAGRLLELFIAILISAVLAILESVLLALFSIRSARYWFPARTKLAENPVGMDAEGKIRRWHYIVIGIWILPTLGFRLFLSFLGL